MALRSRLSPSLPLTLMALTLGLASAVLAPGLTKPVGANGPSHVGIVVDFGTGQVETRCIPFTGDSITGMEALESESESGKTFTLQLGFGDQVVCGIDGTGCPSGNCWCQCPSVGENCKYWTYWHLQGDEWESSGGGAAGYAMHEGDVDGWRWGHPAPPYGDGQPPPVHQFADICSGYLPETYTEAVTAVQVCETISVTADYHDDCNANGSCALTYTHSLTPGVGGIVPSMEKDDGAKSYTASVPVTVSGRYDLDVRYADPDGVVGEYQHHSVVHVELPHAGFEVSPSLVMSGAVTQFIDRSEGGVVSAWEWDFGDGSEIAHTQNPTHTYVMTGFPTVVLTSTIGACGTYVTTRQLHVVESDHSYLPILLKQYGSEVVGEWGQNSGF